MWKKRGPFGNDSPLKVKKAGMNEILKLNERRRKKCQKKIKWKGRGKTVDYLLKNNNFTSSWQGCFTILECGEAERI